MHETVVSGVGMTAFGRYPERTFKSLVAEATRLALSDACLQPDDVGFVYYSNCCAGILQGQESLRGQHAVADTGLQGVPLINVENACASGSTALHQARLAVASGQVEVALAIGAEKLTHPDRNCRLAAMSSALDQDRLAEIAQEIGPSGSGSVFMDIYARWAQWYLDRTDATVRDFAAVTAKNHRHGLNNRKAQYGAGLTVDEVLAAPRVNDLLTVPMCAPMSDGAAAVVVTTPEIAAKAGAHPVTLLATVLTVGRAGIYGELVPATARRAYEVAGIDPNDVDVVECHDATAPAELIVLEELGLCERGKAAAHLRAGDTTVGGRLPVNPSGGLQSRGHPVGATGVAQIVELADQLRGRAGGRQVDNARIALAENAGGYLGPDTAVAAVTVLQRR